MPIYDKLFECVIRIMLEEFKPAEFKKVTSSFYIGTNILRFASEKVVEDVVKVCVSNLYSNIAEGILVSREINFHKELLSEQLKFECLESHREKILETIAKVIPLPYDKFHFSVKLLTAGKSGYGKSYLISVVSRNSNGRAAMFVIQIISALQDHEKSWKNGWPLLRGAFLAEFSGVSPSIHCVLYQERGSGVIFRNGIVIDSGKDPWFKRIREDKEMQIQLAETIMSMQKVLPKCIEVEEGIEEQGVRKKRDIVKFRLNTRLFAWPHMMEQLIKKFSYLKNFEIAYALYKKIEDLEKPFDGPFLCHGDLHTINIIEANVCNGSVLYPIDFEFSATGKRYYDLAFINHFLNLKMEEELRMLSIVLQNVWKGDNAECQIDSYFHTRLLVCLYKCFTRVITSTFSEVSKNDLPEEKSLAEVKPYESYANSETGFVAAISLLKCAQIFAKEKIFPRKTSIAKSKEMDAFLSVNNWGTFFTTTIVVSDEPPNTEKPLNCSVPDWT